MPLTFAPVLPWWVIAASALAVVASTALLLARGTRPSRKNRPVLLRAAALLLLLAAALRPGWSGGDARTAAAGLDVFFVVDSSTSMAAEDYGTGAPRLDGVRSDIAAIARELAGAKFALITFDSDAGVRMPLTRDADALAAATDILQPQAAVYARGSSVTAAGPVLKERLTAAREQHPGRPAVVFYLGDGENTSMKQAAADLGIDPGLVSGGAVLGYGSGQGGRMVAGDGAYLQENVDGGRQDALSRIDEGQLRRIADGLGVPYVHRDSGDAIGAALDDARPGNLSAAEEDGEGRTELYWIPALLAFAAALPGPTRHAVELRRLSAGVTRTGRGGGTP
ncbi:vWA domain-containing protein [Arthrobacter celericrescens]|uniref:vWA domain-containing protein n=1 Tax=Arthrobacter celericrescens TaxID=2320851 RepID=UPI001FDFF616|nr:VWA domain-containing protein [Arthrobacter celericrescens]